MGSSIHLTHFYTGDVVSHWLAQWHHDCVTRSCSHEHTASLVNGRIWPIKADLKKSFSVHKTGDALWCTSPSCSKAASLHLSQRWCSRSNKELDWDLIKSKNMSPNIKTLVSLYVDLQSVICFFMQLSVIAWPFQLISIYSQLYCEFQVCHELLSFYVLACSIYACVYVCVLLVGQMKALEWRVGTEVVTPRVWRLAVTESCCRRLEVTTV